MFIFIFHVIPWLYFLGRDTHDLPAPVVLVLHNLEHARFERRKLLLLPRPVTAPSFSPPADLRIRFGFILTRPPSHTELLRVLLQKQRNHPTVDFLLLPVPSDGRTTLVPWESSQVSFKSALISSRHEAFPPWCMDDSAHLCEASKGTKIPSVCAGARLSLSTYHRFYGATEIFGIYIQKFQMLRFLNAS